MKPEIKQNFKRGDVVQLKSGGPIMTVDSYVVWSDLLASFQNRVPEESHETEIINCTWFDNKSQRKFGKFHQDLLKSAEV